jgi:hypothetical protein
MKRLIRTGALCAVLPGFAAAQQDTQEAERAMAEFEQSLEYEQGTISARTSCTGRRSCASARKKAMC